MKTEGEKGEKKKEKGERRIEKDRGRKDIGKDKRQWMEKYEI